MKWSWPKTHKTTNRTAALAPARRELRARIRITQHNIDMLGTSRAGCSAKPSAHNRSRWSFGERANGRTLATFCTRPILSHSYAKQQADRRRRRRRRYQRFERRRCRRRRQRRQPELKFWSDERASERIITRQASKHPPPIIHFGNRRQHGSPSTSNFSLPFSFPFCRLGRGAPVRTGMIFPFDGSTIAQRARAKPNENGERKNGKNARR